MRGTLLKGIGVVIGATALSTIGIFAADQIRNVDHNLAGLVGLSDQRMCPDGMTVVQNGDNSFCVDLFEASGSEGCPHINPQNTIESEANAKSESCFVASKRSVEPLRFVTLTQAQLMCARSGKRLPSRNEWYRAALGTPEEECAIAGSDRPKPTGSSACISAAGVYDMIGNVWEWVDETVVGYVIDGQPIPPEGYVDSVDASGLAVTTSDSSSEAYGEDYFWSKPEGVYGMIRGGYFGSGSDAGLYTANAAVASSFASPGIGFRCIKDI